MGGPESINGISIHFNGENCRCLSVSMTLDAAQIILEVTNILWRRKHRRNWWHYIFKHRRLVSRQRENVQRLKWQIGRWHQLFNGITKDEGKGKLYFNELWFKMLWFKKKRKKPWILGKFIMVKFEPKNYLIWEKRWVHFCDHNKDSQEIEVIPVNRVDPVSSSIGITDTYNSCTFCSIAPMSWSVNVFRLWSTSRMFALVSM